MYSRILVPIDGSDYAQKGLEAACALAEYYSSKLILLCVTDANVPEEMAVAAINEGIIHPASYKVFSSTLSNPSIAGSVAEASREAVLTRATSAIANEVVSRGADFAKDSELSEVKTIVRSGDTVKRIVEVADEQIADLIVIGSHHREGLDALFHSSVASAVQKRANCPTFILHPKGEVS